MDFPHTKILDQVSPSGNFDLRFMKFPFLFKPKFPGIPEILFKIWARHALRAVRTCVPSILAIPLKPKLPDKPEIILNKWARHALRAVRTCDQANIVIFQESYDLSSLIILLNPFLASFSLIILSLCSILLSKISSIIIFIGLK